MPWTSEEMSDQTGRTVLVTGANSGLGLETTRAFLQKGATVIMGCRSISRAQSAIDGFLKKIDKGNISLLEIDLGDLTKVASAAENIMDKYGHLDLLINNAGVMAPPYTLSKQGFEIQFAVNHLGHMALTIKLLPILERKVGARIVTVSSGAQFMGQIDWEDMQGKKRYDRWRAYSQSKLANVMFALELDDRLKTNKSMVSSLVAHPGLARTNLQLRSIKANNSWQEGLAYKFIQPLFQGARMGSLPQLFAATDPSAKGGQQYGPRFNFRGYPKLCNSAASALKKDQRKRFWELSEELIGMSFK